MGNSSDQRTTTAPCCRTSDYEPHHHNDDHQHIAAAAESAGCSCLKKGQLSSKSQTKIRPLHASWLNISLIVLALVFPLILESNLSSCTPVVTNEQYFHSKYSHHPNSYRQQQLQQIQLQQQQQQQAASPSLHHTRLQRHYRPLSDNMETSLDSSASLSIVSPLDILRQNLLLEIHRQRLRLAQTKQVESNREFLEKIG